MSMADLKSALSASLKEAVSSKFTDPDFERHLKLAALDLGRKRERTLVGSVTLVADQAEYAAPADLLRPKMGLWGRAQRNTGRHWEGGFLRRLPMLRKVELGGAVMLSLDPAPSADEIAMLGSDYRFYYYAGHVISETAAKTSVHEADRGLLLLRAQAEALKELAARHATKPVQLRDGMGQGSSNGTPAALFKQLMDMFEAAA